MLFMENEIWELLRLNGTGNREAAEKLLTCVYDELKQMATRQMAREKPGQTLSPTALVHEAWLRLMKPAAANDWNSQAHFFSAAAEAMRRILIEQARRKKRLKHGGDQVRIDRDLIDIPIAIEDEQLLAVHEALERLAEQSPELAQVAKFKFFLGFTSLETATAMEVSEATVKRRWRLARAWLARELDLSIADDST